MNNRLESGTDTAASMSDRLDAPPFHRNHGPILDVLRQELTPASGHVLEVGSGSGQHIVGFSRDFPNIVWHPSDPDERHRRSISAWSETSDGYNLRTPLDLDVRLTDWPLPEEVNRAPSLNGIVCINVLHISHWYATCGLLAGASRYLTSGGKLVIYGPFKRDGRHTAPSNAEFDESLRGRNSDWGIRDVGDIEIVATNNGLSLAKIYPMPANNFILVFTVDT